MEVKDGIDENLRQHELFVAIYCVVLINFPDIDGCEADDESSDFSMVNPDLIDFNVSSGHSHHICVPSTTVESLLLPQEQFYSMCSQSNDTEEHFISFIMI